MLLRSLRRSWPGLIGVTLLLIIVGCAVFAPVVAPQDPARQRLNLALRPPFWLDRGNIAYPLGNDQLGRDVLSRIIYGARVSLLVGFASVALSATIGITLGLLAGFFGGAVDDVLMRIVEVQLSLPFLLFALVIAAVLGPSLINIILIFGISDYPIYARITRGEVLRLRRTEFVEAATMLGATSPHILLRHLLPNAWAPLIVVGTFELAAMILAEAGMGFLGLGVPPSIPSWGNMLADGRNYLATAWWTAVFPGIAIMLTALGANLTGDWLRDALDPHRSRARQSEVPTGART